MTENFIDSEPKEPIYVQNESSLDKVESRFLPVLEAARGAYRDIFGQDLHSVYLEGSVGRGQYVEGVSDIDTRALVTRPISDEDLDALSQHRQGILEEFPWATKVDLSAQYLDNFKHRPRGQFIIATEGVLLEGEPAPITAEFPPIGSELAKFINEGTSQRQQEVHDILARDGEIPEQLCIGRSRWLAKRGLRVLLGMAMTAKPVYTHTVSEVAPLVSTILPDKAALVEKLDSVRLEPIKDRSSLAELTALVDDLYEDAKKIGIG